MTSLTPKTIPGSIQDYYFDWAKLDEPKTNWYIDKAEKRIKGRRIVVFTPDVNGFHRLSVHNSKTMEQVYEFFADCDNISAATSLVYFGKNLNQYGNATELFCDSRK